MKPCLSRGAVALTLTGFLLTSCTANGTTTAKPSPSIGSGSVCSPPAPLDELSVRRHDAFPSNRTVFIFPPTVTVTDAASVAEVAAVACALPRAPDGVFHCPVDTGIDYRLTFSAFGRAFPPVTVGATGCQTLRGLGIDRSPSGQFWATLARALGLPNTLGSTFQGHIGHSHPLGATP